MLVTNQDQNSHRVHLFGADWLTLFIARSDLEGEVRLVEGHFEVVLEDGIEVGYPGIFAFIFGERSHPETTV